MALAWSIKALAASVDDAAAKDHVYRCVYLILYSSELLTPSLTLIYQASLHQCSLPADQKGIHCTHFQEGQS